MDLKTAKNKTKEWWNKYKTTIKLVVVSTSIGILYGLTKGMTLANSCWADICSEPIVDDEFTNRKHVEVSDPLYVNFVEFKRKGEKK